MTAVNPTIQVAIIGCGNIGAGVSNYSAAVRPGSHADAYRLRDDVEIVGLLETSTERQVYLEKEYPGVPIFESIEALFAVASPDIVSIASPTQFHAEHVLAVAAYAPKAILCEKPLAYTQEDGEKMVATCKEKGIKLFVNHQRHFDPLLQKWAGKLHNGLLGNLYQGNAYYYNGLFNNGTHLVDILRIFCGEVVSVSGVYNERTSNNGELDKNIDGELIFESGLRVTLHSLSKNYGFFGFSLFGDDGMLSVQNLGFEVAYRKKIDNKNFPGFFELSQDAVIEGKPRSMIQATIDHVIAVVRDGISSYGTGEDALAVLTTLLAIERSAKEKEKNV